MSDKCELPAGMIREPKPCEAKATPAKDCCEHAPLPTTAPRSSMPYSKLMAPIHHGTTPPKC